MIIKASQRGGTAKLAAHLLNEQDNEHVEVYEVSGFMSHHLRGAMDETYAISKGTRCKQPVFSVSLSPPQQENVTITTYEDATKRIEEAMKLQGQPRVIVFHEKEGRRHAHVVWSRIDAQQMKAINLPYFKNRMTEVSKSLYLDYGWELPKGFINREMRNPLNFTREQWQQAKRLNEDARLIKAALNDSWTNTKTLQAFKTSLEKRGFYLARGDRRSYVVVDWRGEVLSLSRWLNTNKKELKTKLGDHKTLPSVDEVTTNIDQKRATQTKTLIQNIKTHYHYALKPIIQRKEAQKTEHQQERKALKQAQLQRKQEQIQEHQARLRKGVLGLWDRLTGRHSKTRKQNEQEAQASKHRDQEEYDQLIAQQQGKRQHIQTVINNYRQKEQEELQSMKEAVFSKLPDKNVTQYQSEFDRIVKQQDQTKGLER
ncbi:hypothetical protein AB835_14450 [Candidatus Endobugula sertula]|uniref:MobA/VirD2-like nuclease domain-containing protein n=1 Tax=Candidatus Endobugula sertula TaxID=62101 RepID=A0A1D2QLD6_9GAMM|nr:hypothetical protein AB835_14450 [Candidatus Endobugula sertula]